MDDELNGFKSDSIDLYRSSPNILADGFFVG